MGIYIKDMDMPPEQVTAVINPNGLVEILSLDNVLLDEFYAISIPPHGKWILYNKGFGFTHYCSNCNFAVKEQWIGFYNFCPSCGADMREAEDKDANT